MAAPAAIAQPHSGDRWSSSREVFSNFNTSACEMTDTAGFMLDRSIHADRFNLRIHPGAYLIRTNRARVCQNPGSDGNGFVKVYGARR